MRKNAAAYSQDMILWLKNYYNSARSKKVFLPRNEDDDFEKNANFDFSSLVGIKLDKSYGEARFSTF